MGLRRQSCLLHEPGMEVGQPLHIAGEAGMGGVREKGRNFVIDVAGSM